MADIPRYTNSEPTLQIGEVKMEGDICRDFSESRSLARQARLPAA